MYVLQEQGLLPIKINRFTSMVYGLGAGFGYTGLVCGAVSAAVIAIGMDVTARVADPIEARRHILKATQRFIKKVEAKFGSTICRDLLPPGFELTGEDFTTGPAGRRKFQETPYDEIVCKDIQDYAVLYPLPSEEGLIPSEVLDPLPPEQPFSTL